MSIILCCILSWNKASNILIKFLKGSKNTILSSSDKYIGYYYVII